MDKHCLLAWYPTWSVSHAQVVLSSAQAHLLMNIVTLSARAFPHQSSTLSSTDIATSHSDESTPSTDASSDDCNFEMLAVSPLS